MLRQWAMRSDDTGPWQTVPWWHWRAWFCRNFVSAPMLMRRRVWERYTMGGEYDATWEYADVETIAWQELEARFGNV